MPVEIRELQITTVVQDTASQMNTSSGTSSISTDNIVAQCVEQVLDILKQKTER